MNQIKGIVIDIVIVFIIPMTIFVSYILIRGEMGKEPSSEQQELAEKGAKFFRNLEELRSIKIETSILEHPAFPHLTNFSLPHPESEQGRANPYILPAPTSTPAKTSKK